MILRLAVLAAALLVAAPAFAAPPPTPAAPSEADWRTPDPQNVLVIDTNKGRIFVELAPLLAPRSVAQVRDLARAGFYDGRAFFRVIDDFMDQTGDPQDNGQGGSTMPNLPGEFTFRRGGATPMIVIDSEGGREKGFIGALPVMSQPAALAAMTVDHTVSAAAMFCTGVVGMARAQDPDSGNSQFFLMRNAQHNLDGQYTAIGRIIAGEDVVKSIKTGEPVAPPQDKMLKVRVLADIAPAERPSVRVIDTAGPWFTAEVARVKAEKLVGLSPCDLNLPSQVK
ncbi:MAG TPA: peptidylprolyl isomerase [Caulobacteraceae bacterium]|nr:peptidylprolyl isomerase [Caulobacteraceae bacterium]